MATTCDSVTPDPADNPAARFWPGLRVRLPYLLAAGLFAFGLWALYRLLAPVDLADVALQVRATPWSLMALGLLATLCGYLSLTGYDWSALRHIGKPLPLPVVMTGGLMAYAFGNTIGLSAVSGGAVRWRVYAGLGLDGYDVAAVSTFAAVSFGVATTVVGLGALAIHPSALGDLLPVAPAALRLIAIVAIIAIVLPLCWASISRRRLALGRVTLAAPSLPILAAQLLFGLADIGFAALTLYVLLPVPELDFLTFLAVFAAAIMAGVISHVPGGLGVFETVVIAAMPAGTPVDRVAAALILYRMVYFLVPFVLALVVLALYEAWRSRSAFLPATPLGRGLAAVEPALAAVAPLAPLVLSVMIFGSGLWMSLSSLIPPTSEAAEFAQALFPLAFVEGSAVISSALGALLIVVALGIVRKSLGAFWLAVSAIAAGMVVALMQGLDWQRVAILGLAMLVLLPFQPEFHRRSTLVHAAFDPGWILLILTSLAAFGFVLFFAHKSTPYANELWWQFALDESAPRALRAGLVASLSVGLAAVVLLLRAPRHRYVRPDAQTLARAANIVVGSGRSEAGLALSGDKALIFSDDGRAFVTFAVSGRSWISYGGPVGPADAAEEVAFTFVDAARRAGARPVFYEVSARDVPLMLDLGLMLHKMGEEAVIDLDRFSLQGPARKKLRAAHARAGRDGLSLQILQPPHDSRLIDELRAVSDDWLRTRRSREKGFSVGRFDADWLDRWPLAVVRHQGRIVAFANLLVTQTGEMATLDLMRHGRDAPTGTMEFLITDVLLRLKANGYRSFSLGMAPLSGLAPERSRKLWDRFGALIYRHGSGFYNFAGLRAFKAKFDPDWRPRYLAAPSALPPILTLADAARLIGGRAANAVNLPAPTSREACGIGPLDPLSAGLPIVATGRQRGTRAVLTPNLGIS